MLRYQYIFALLLISLLVSSCGKKATVRKSSGPPDPYKLVSTDPSGGFGTYLGNGSIGVRLHAEGLGSHNGQELKCLMAGFYKDEALVPLPHFSDLPLYLGTDVQPDKRFMLDTEAPYEQTLDMNAGFLCTKCSLRQGSRSLDADILFMVSQDSDRIEISTRLLPHFNGPVTVLVGFGKPAEGLEVLSSGRSGKHGQLITCKIKSQTEQVSLVTDLAVGANVASSRTVSGMGTLVTIDVEDSKPVVLKKFVEISRESGIPAKVSTTSDFTPMWTSGIQIVGDPEAQQAVNSCLFYLLGSVREGTDYSIPPTGISNDAWGGHVFWDADTWMFPALLPQYPELAKSIVAYRFETLTGAKQNAKKRGLKGAEYAWESARTGLETIGIPFSEERHITSDVALAQWQYYQVTQDKKWLAEFGYPVISACADYWVTRVKYNPVQGYYEILDVVPPDEDSEIVDNSVYTNAGAKKTLEVAAQAAKLLGKQAPKQWLSVAAKMYIPYDKKNDRFVEYPGFNKKMTKQADTELLIYPLEHPMSDKTRINTFDYWAKKVNPRGPAMSSSVHAVIAARMGRAEEAYGYFTESYKPFFRKPFNYFNEKRSEMYENMCFMTGAAGPVQAVIYGFCGLRYDNNGKITLDPHLPRKWKSVTLKNVYSGGKRYDIVIRQGQKPQIQLSP